MPEVRSAANIAFFPMASQRSNPCVLPSTLDHAVPESETWNASRSDFEIFDFQLRIAVCLHLKSRFSVCGRSVFLDWPQRELAGEEGPEFGGPGIACRSHPTPEQQVESDTKFIRTEEWGKRTNLKRRVSNAVRPVAALKPFATTHSPFLLGSSGHSVPR